MRIGPIRPGVSFDVRELGLHHAPPRPAHPGMTLLALALWFWPYVWLALWAGFMLARR
jgi:hypothetical protein